MSWLLMRSPKMISELCKYAEKLKHFYRCCWSKQLEVITENVMANVKSAQSQDHFFRIRFESHLVMNFLIYCPWAKMGSYLFTTSHNSLVMHSPHASLRLPRLLSSLFLCTIDSLPPLSSVMEHFLFVWFLPVVKSMLGLWHFHHLCP